MSILPLSTDPLMVSFGTFLLAAGLPISMACNQAIIQKKVSSSYIGRVDGMGMLLINIAMPLGYLLAGPLAEVYFEPFMLEASTNNALFANIFGVGKGRGIALMVSLISLILVMVVVLATLVPKIRRVELDLDDEE